MLEHVGVARSSNPPGAAPFRVLSLDGGGMRGVYQCACLQAFATRIHGSTDDVDLGKGFDLIAGTSTGAIVACALFAGIPLTQVHALYREHGQRIFPHQRWRAMPWAETLVRAIGLGLEDGDRALADVLCATFGSRTIGQVYEDRRIALAVPTLDLHRHAPVVFKTRHLRRLSGRDDPRRLADICLASSAAPMLRASARLVVPGIGTEVTTTYVDGGLWANNPALTAFTEAVEILQDRNQSDRPIHLFTVGTLSDAGGEEPPKLSRFRSAWGWRAGLRALTASINARSATDDYHATKFAEFRGKGDLVYRIQTQGPSGELRELLPKMDDARQYFLNALARQAICDVDHSWAQLPQNEGVAALHAAIAAAPVRGRHVRAA